MLQAGRMEVGKLSATDQSSLSALPRWQEACLVQMGIESGAEVTLGRDPPADPRLVAAARVLAATSHSQLLGRGPDELGKLDRPLFGDVEVCHLWTTHSHSSNALLDHLILQLQSSMGKLQPLLNGIVNMICLLQSAEGAHA